MELQRVVMKPLPRRGSTKSNDLLLTPSRASSSPPLPMLSPQGSVVDMDQAEDEESQQVSTAPDYIETRLLHGQDNRRGLRRLWLHRSPTNKPNSEHLPAKAFQGRWQTGFTDRSCLRHVGIFTGLLALTAVPGAFYAAINYDSTYRSTYPITYNCASSQPFLSIDMRFGPVSFAHAKAIDLMWNWIVGRGIQVSLAFICYRVYADVLMRVSELAPVPYELFASLALYSARSDTLWQLIKSLKMRTSWRVKATLTYLLFSTTYLMIFPSLVDACSGYDAEQNAEFVWPDKSMTMLADITANPDTYYEVNSGYYCGNLSDGTVTNFTIGNITDTSSDQISDICAYDEFQIFDMHLPYFRNEQLNQSWWSLWNQSAQSDLKNIEDFSTEPPWYGTNKTNFQYAVLPDVYSWGFSSSWVSLTLALNSAWLLGLWLLWLDADHNSELIRKGRRFGLWRAVADLSEAIREELGDNICAYSEEELKYALSRRDPVRYVATESVEIADVDGDGEIDGKRTGHVGLSSKGSGRLRLNLDIKYGGRKVH